jgi:hypothetical protein
MEHCCFVLKIEMTDERYAQVSGGGRYALASGEGRYALASGPGARESCAASYAQRSGENPAATKGSVEAVRHH